MGNIAGVVALALVIGGGGAVFAAGGRPALDVVIVHSQGSDTVGQPDYLDRAEVLCPEGYSVTGGGYMFDIDERDSHVQFNGPIDRDGRQGWLVQVLHPTLSEFPKIPVSAKAICLKTPR